MRIKRCPPLSLTSDLDPRVLRDDALTDQNKIKAKLLKFAEETAAEQFFLIAASSRITGNINLRTREMLATEITVCLLAVLTDVLGELVCI